MPGRDGLTPRPGRAAGRVPTGELRVYLHPGQFAVSADDCTMSTILGSCVGVCLHDPVTRVGGLNHFLLPVAPPDAPSPRFGDVAMQRLIAEVCALGAQRGRLLATVIGGACVIEAYQGKAASLGLNNVEAARRALREAGIRITQEQILGNRGRRVAFAPRSGAVLVREL